MDQIFLHKLVGYLDSVLMRVLDNLDLLGLLSLSLGEPIGLLAIVETFGGVNFGL